MRRLFVFLLVVVLVVMGCGQNRETPSPPPPTASQSVNFLTILHEYGYDPELVGADPTRAAVKVLGCWIMLRLHDDVKFRVEDGINGRPHSDAVQDALDGLGANPTKEALEKTLKGLINSGKLDPC